MELKTLQPSVEPQAVLLANPKRKHFHIVLKSAGPIICGGKGMPQASITRDESYSLDGEKAKGIFYVVPGMKAQVITIHEEMEEAPAGEFQPVQVTPTSEE